MVELENEAKGGSWPLFLLRLQWAVVSEASITTHLRGTQLFWGCVYVCVVM